jgi:uncharacterized protein YkwD
LRRQHLLALLIPALFFVAACNPVMQLDAVMRVNQTRAALGRPPVRVTEELTVKAQQVADHLAAMGRLEHSADLSSGIAGPYELIGENEGYGPSVEQIHTMLIHSPDHFAIMIDPRYTEIGIGIAIAADGTVYEVQEYKAP